MREHSQIRLIKHFQMHRATIDSLITSMTTTLDSQQLMHSRVEQVRAVNHLSIYYPFIELIYSLDSEGIQLIDTACSPRVSERKRRELGKGIDRSERPYMVAARQSDKRVLVTEPYLSSATHQLAISCVHQIHDGCGKPIGYLVININLQRLVNYLNGDGARAKVYPFFQFIYGLISSLLIAVSLLLLFGAGQSFYRVFELKGDVTVDSFGIVILASLGLAIFDLGKTIFEEEVLAGNDIYHHHDTSRRTITRFMSVIVIAISIESLLLMFKSLLAENIDDIIIAVWMLIAAVALLAGLGVYLKLSKETA